MIYTLTARLTSRDDVLPDSVDFEHVHADNDRDAMFTATFRVMDRAAESATWARGSVVLTGPAGQVVCKMDERDG